MAEKKVFDKLFQALNKQLEAHKIIVKKGILVDASITKSPFLPHQKPDFELIPVDPAEIGTQEDDGENNADISSKNIENNSEKQISSIQKINSGNTQASWLKKTGKYCFGYKKQLATAEQGLILGLLSSTVSVAGDFRYLWF